MFEKFFSLFEKKKNDNQVDGGVRPSEGETKNDVSPEREIAGEPGAVDSGEIADRETGGTPAGTELRESDTEHSRTAGGVTIVEAPPAGVQTEQPREKKSWFEKLREGLSKTRARFVRRLQELVGARLKLDSDFLEKIEEVLIEADVGPRTTAKILDALNERLDERKVTTGDELMAVLKEIILAQIDTGKTALNIGGRPLSVVLVIGVNGAGKTTTIGKIAHRLLGRGHRVLIAAADTFRAAAIDQLEIWAARAGVPLVKHQPGADAGAVVYDAIQAAKARGNDVILVDTAGRLHTKFNLMEELKKVHRVIAREVEGAPHEVLQVLDATTGQNAIQQAESFNKALGITGIVLTKLDGTAKGGMVLAIREVLSVPVKFIGVGEGIDDLKEFDGKEYVDALFA